MNGLTFLRQVGSSFLRTQEGGVDVVLDTRIISFDGGIVATIDAADPNLVHVALGGAGALGLQGAYNNGPDIVSTAVVGPLGGPVDIEKGVGTAVGDSVLYVADLNVVVNRTAPLVLIEDNNDGGVANFAAVEIRKNNSTNSGVNLLLSGADLGSLGPILRLFHNTATPAVNDAAGRIAFAGRDSGAGIEEWARIQATVTAPGAGVEEATLDFSVNLVGTMSRVLRLSPLSVAAEGQAFIRNDSAAGAIPAFAFSATSAFGAGQPILTMRSAGNTRFQMDGDGDLTLTSTDAGAVGVELQLYQNSATPAATDSPGFISFYGQDSAANKQEYGEFVCTIVSTTSTSETGCFEFYNMTSGTLGRSVRVLGASAAAQQGLILENFLAAGLGNTQFEMRLTENSATVGPVLSIFRNRTNDAVDGDAIGRIQFDGMDDSTPVRASYHTISVLIDDSGVGSMDGHVDHHLMVAGTLGRLYSIRGTAIAGAEQLVQYENYSPAGATTYQFEWMLTDAGAVVGPVLSLFRNSASAAAGDDIGAIAFTGFDSTPTKTEWTRIWCEIVSPTAGTSTSRFNFDTTDAGVKNLAMTIESTGQITADLGAGTGNVTIFDDYDDALVLREMFPMGERKQEALDKLVEMGVCTTKDSGSGYMVNVQKMFALLGGGIYQGREKLDTLAAECAMLRARLAALEAK